MRKPDYDHGMILGKVLWMADNDTGGISLTNGMETALKDMAIQYEIDLTKVKIVYCDSDGNWDQVSLDNGSVEFSFLGARTRDEAVIKVLAK